MPVSQSDLNDTAQSCLAMLDRCVGSVVRGDRSGWERDWSRDNHAPLLWLYGSVLFVWWNEFVSKAFPGAHPFFDKKTMHMFIPLGSYDLEFGSRFDMKLPGPNVLLSRSESLLEHIRRFNRGTKAKSPALMDAYQRCLRFSARAVEEMLCDHHLHYLPNPLVVYPFNISAKVVPLNVEFVDVEGGRFFQGSTESPFPEEKVCHDAAVAAFKVSKFPVTQGQFLGFVEDGGYRTARFWSVQGKRWLKAVRPLCPLTWKVTDGVWYRRLFDKWVILEPNKPMVHANFFEAEAYCKWADGRLLTESEWEYLATEGGASEDMPQYGGNIGVEKFDVQSVEEESTNALGVAGMVGNVWCWCLDPLRPYPGFSTEDTGSDEVLERFGKEYVIRGGSWASIRTSVSKQCRESLHPSSRKNLTGFRIARDNNF